MNEKIDNKLWELQRICNERDTINNGYRGRWTLYAITSYINTGRASLEWTQKFINLSKKQLQKLVEISEKGDGSDQAIINKINKYLKYKAV